MQKLIGTLAFAVAGGLGGPALAQDCGSPLIASMNWQSAEVLASLDKIILNEGYGCNADIIVGDTVPTITSMVEKGEPDLAPEGWVDLLPEVVGSGISEGKLVAAAVPRGAASHGAASRGFARRSRRSRLKKLRVPDVPGERTAATGMPANSSKPPVR